MRARAAPRKSTRSDATTARKMPLRDELEKVLTLVLQRISLAEVLRGDLVEAHPLLKNFPSCLPSSEKAKISPEADGTHEAAQAIVIDKPLAA